MPGLMELIWVHLAHSSRMLEFLSCRVLAEGCLIEMKNPRMKGHCAHLLKLWFERNTFGAVVLALPTDALAMPAPQIMGHQSVTFFDFMPPAGILTQLLEFITFHFPSEADQQQTFWAFLEDLSVSVHHAQQESAKCTMGIFYTDDQGFDWLGGSDRDPEYSAFIGRLLKVAVLLYWRSIVIQDVNSSDVTSLI
jgi:hypothetical protein